MNGEQVVRRLRAWAEGHPLPRGSTRHFPIAAPRDLLILSFVRMGGESAPWGICYGHPGTRPTVLTVPEARNRDLVADMVARFAPTLLRHFGHPEYAGAGDGQLRQLWLPNPTHLEMLHNLAYAYTFTKWGARERLNALGRLAGWLFREAMRPGQVTVMVATDALRSMYSFPAEDVRQAHLGFLLAWLETRGNREARLRAAADAEQHSVATSLDPAVERERLDDLVDEWNEARRKEDGTAAARLDKAVGSGLQPELLRRHTLVEKAIEVLRRDPRLKNPGVAQLQDASLEERAYQYLRLEGQFAAAGEGPAFTPSPETDRHPAAAAARYYIHQASEELQTAALIHYDQEMQEEAIAAGDAFRGPIVSVTDEGTGRKTIPVWVVEAPDESPLRLREGSRLCVAGLPDRTVIVRGLERTATGAIRLKVEVTGLKTRPRESGSRVRPAADKAHLGTTVLLVPTSMERMTRLKARKIWQKGAGSWLTHARPGGPAAALPAEVGEDLAAVARGVTA